MGDAHPHRSTADTWRPAAVDAALATAAVLIAGPMHRPGLALVPLVFMILHAVHRAVRSAARRGRAERVDALTGLPNRRALHARLAASHGERRLALLVLDLDRFRAVNDAFGHAYGDRLLIEVARRLSAAVPPHDLLVRLGGDEFAVLATRVDGPAAARRIADAPGRGAASAVRPRRARRST